MPKPITTTYQPDADYIHYTSALNRLSSPITCNNCHWLIPVNGSRSWHRVTKVVVCTPCMLFLTTGDTNAARAVARLQGIEWKGDTSK